MMATTPANKPRRIFHRGVSFYTQGVNDRKAGKPMAAGPTGVNFPRWFEGWTDEDERIRKAKQSM